MSKYKLVKKLPFINSPEVGYISTSRSNGEHYWNHSWFHPEEYPEFWKKVEEIPEYVKLISGWSVNDEFVGKIFSTKLDFQEQFKEFKGINKTWDWESIFSDNFFKYHGKYFEPSTKEEFNKQQLLEEAKKKYPVGTKYKGIVCGKIFTITNDINFKIINTLDNEIAVDTKANWAMVYYRNQWAEIVKPIFTTEDGVDIYDKNEKLFEVILSTYHLNENIPYIACNNVSNKCKDCNPSLVFSTKEVAQKWIDENKPKEKILEDYEKSLVSGTSDDEAAILYYELLKQNDPRLYWSKILRSVADDLNGNIYLDFKKEHYFYNIYWDIKYSKYGINTHCGQNEDCTYFTSKENAEKAMEILGESNLDKIFK